MKPFLSKPFWQSVKIVALTSLRETYRNSFLGILWSMIQPTAYILVLSIVFSVMSRGSAKDIFVYSASGMVAWQFMTGAFTRASASLISRRTVFHHSVLPKSLFILSDLIVAAYVFVIMLAVMFFLLMVLGKAHLLALVYLPLALVPMLIFCMGGCFMLAYLSPYVGDIPHLTNLFFMVAFWTCPIAYPLEMIPEDKRIYFAYNPLYLIVEPVQRALHRGEPPIPSHFAIAMGVALVTCLIGYATYVRLRRRVIYYL